MLRAHMAITVVVAAALGFSFWQHPIPSWGVRQIIGLVLLVVGFILWTVGRFQLGASFAVSAQARRLVTGGLYSRIRNPIYVFGSCFVAGFILLFARPGWLLIFIPLILLQMWRARNEARVLEEAFGEQYRAYRAATWF